MRNQSSACSISLRRSFASPVSSARRSATHFSTVGGKVVRQTSPLLIGIITQAAPIRLPQRAPSSNQGTGVKFIKIVREIIRPFRKLPRAAQPCSSRNSLRVPSTCSVRPMSRKNRCYNHRIPRDSFSGMPVPSCYDIPAPYSRAPVSSSLPNRRDSRRSA